ncbi:MAG TPA: tripartite tricarboxylate transporter TctB family protein [Burkholderiales bacterium]|nr:tripartite tricarboxylate transporter TctB family protein [Burkholderiales bacterium]
MSQNHPANGDGVRSVVVDLAVAVAIFALGALVLYDSVRLGASWTPEGPQPGYFPFYIGLLICISSLAVFAGALLKLRSDRAIFVRRHEFRRVLVILLPSTAYVLGVQLIGIYVSSALFIGLFMRLVGRYGWLRSAGVGIGVSVVAFMLFEVWFKIPLPKGPLEALIGY